MFGHILIPIDGSTLSAAAADKAMAFAKEIGAKVTVVTVIEPFNALLMRADALSGVDATIEREARDAATRFLKEATLMAGSHGIKCETHVLESNAPHQVIVAFAIEQKCDLIAMASHGRRGISALILGSETLKVLTTSKIPVLVYR